MLENVKRLLNQLNQPYPFGFGTKNVLKNALIVGLFVFLFLYLFKPFGKGEFNNPYWEFAGTLGYGGVTFFVMLINYLILPRIFPKIINEENWKIKHEILTLGWLLFTIGIGNFFYNHFVQQTEFSLKTFWQFQGYTFLLGVIIAAFFLMGEQNWLLRKHLKAAREMNQQLQAEYSAQTAVQRREELLVLTSENEKDQVKIKKSNLIFIHSADNYVEIFQQQKDRVDKILLRSSLKRIEDSLKQHPNIQRCHRAYLVNLKQVYQVAGDSQGYQLQFRNTAFTVPVSRNYSKKIRKSIMHAS